jgi:hypothetical protein
MWSRVMGLALGLACLLGPISPAAASDPHPPQVLLPSPTNMADHLASASPDPSPTTNDQLLITNYQLPPLCSADYQLQHPAACPSFGPGEYGSQILAAGLPYPFPSLPLNPVYPYRGLTPLAYARIVTATAPVYRHPFDALAGLPPLRRFETGFDFVSLRGEVSVDGRRFYQISPSQFMPAEDLQVVQPSSFQGRFLSSPPAAPVGWVIDNVQLSAVPGQPPPPGGLSAGRYQSFDVLGVQRVGDWNWYLIGPNQWIEQRNVALVQPSPPGGAGGAVIAVDTYEQSLGVYVNGALIYATLISSGSRYFPTRPGTFHVWAKLDAGKMSGSYLPDRRDYYTLQDVPWILYYDGDRALHGAYWHDNFGIRTSHGCVNLAPRDALWLFNFAQVGSTVVIFSSG